MACAVAVLKDRAEDPAAPRPGERQPFVARAIWSVYAPTHRYPVGNAPRWLSCSDPRIEVVREAPPRRTIQTGISGYRPARCVAYCRSFGETVDATERPTEPCARWAVHC